MGRKELQFWIHLFQIVIHQRWQTTPTQQSDLSIRHYYGFKTT